MKIYSSATLKKHQTKQKKQHRLYLPKNLFLHEVLPADLLPYQWEAGYFVHLICWRTALKVADKNGFVHLKFDHLREVIPDKLLVRIKKALTEAGVIECDGWYQKASDSGRGKAYGYRLGKKFRAEKTEALLCNSPKVNTKISKSKKQRLDEVGKYLAGWMAKVKIDSDGAKAAVAEACDPESVPRNSLVVDLIANQDLNATMCSYGRLHTPITRLKREARRFLTIEGKELVEVDIANSQPLFLSQLILNFRNNNKDFYSTSSSNYCDSGPSIMASMGLFPVTESQDREGLRADERRYIELCEEGRLYEVLMEAGGFTDRQKMKDDLYHEVFYGQTRIQGPVKDIFRKLFPNVYEVILAAKKKDYRHLSHRLQKAESDLIIQTVCRRLMLDHPDIPVLTIHDSILTTPEHHSTVAEFIRQAFAAVGLLVTLKEKTTNEEEPTEPRHSESEEQSETPAEETQKEEVPVWVLPRLHRLPSLDGSGDRTACGKGLADRPVEGPSFALDEAEYKRPHDSHGQDVVYLRRDYATESYSAGRSGRSEHRGADSESRTGPAGQSDV